MNEQMWWHLARASGMVAAVLLVATLVWGVLLATRALKPLDRPAWLRDMHVWLSGLTIAATAVHLLSLVADSYVEFGWREIVVPMTSQWRPVAVTMGVAALYLLAAVQVTSLFMKRLDKRHWRLVHAGSYALVWFTVVHAGMAGSDVGNRVYQAAAMLLTIAAVTAALLRLVLGRSAGRAEAGRARAGRAQAGRGPRTSAPGSAPVCSPSANVSTPDLKV